MYSITIKKNLYCFKLCKYLFILWTEQFVYEKKNLLNENDIKMLKIVDIYNKKCFKNKKEMLFWKFVGHFCWSSKYFISVHSGFFATQQISLDDDWPSLLRVNDVCRRSSRGGGAGPRPGPPGRTGPVCSLSSLSPSAPAPCGCSPWKYFITMKLSTNESAVR